LGEYREEWEQGMYSLSQRLSLIESKLTKDESKEETRNSFLKQALTRMEKTEKVCNSIAASVDNMRSKLDENEKNVANIRAQVVSATSTQTASKLTDFENRQSGIMEEIAKRLHEVEDSRNRTELNMKLATKELEILFKTEMLESGRETDAKIAELVEATRSLQEKEKGFSEEISKFGVSMEATSRKDLNDVGKRIIEECRTSIVTERHHVEEQLKLMEHLHRESEQRMQQSVHAAEAKVNKTQQSISQLRESWDERVSSMKDTVVSKVTAEIKKVHEMINDVSAQMSMEIGGVREIQGEEGEERRRGLDAVHKRLKEQQEQLMSNIAEVRGSSESSRRVVEAALKASQHAQKVFELSTQHGMEELRNNIQDTKGIGEVLQIKVEHESHEREIFFTGVEDMIREWREAMSSELSAFGHRLDETELKLDAVSDKAQDTSETLSKSLQDNARSVSELKKNSQHGSAAVAEEVNSLREELALKLVALSDQLERKLTTVRREFDSGSSKSQEACDALQEDLASFKQLVRSEEKSLQANLTTLDANVHRVLDVSMPALETRVRNMLEAVSVGMGDSSEQMKVIHALLDESRAFGMKENRGRKEAEDKVALLAERQRESQNMVEAKAQRESELSDELVRANRSIETLEHKMLDLQIQEWYRIRHPEDSIDVAVCKTLQSLRLPFEIVFKRISPGVYMADKKLSISVSDGKALVRIGGGYQPLHDYLQELYAPLSNAMKSPKYAGSSASSSKDTTPVSKVNLY
jgi:hypothetical protein